MKFLYAFIARDKDGDEGLPIFNIPGVGLTPAIAGDQRRLDSLREIITDAGMAEIAEGTDGLRIIRFDRMTTVETIKLDKYADRLPARGIGYVADYKEILAGLEAGDSLPDSLKAILSADYPVQPWHIRTDRHYYAAFGNSEREVSANWLVQFAQAAGGWVPFTQYQVQAFYDARRAEQGLVPESFWFNGLNDHALIVGRKEELPEGGKHTVFFFTHDFVSACFKACPKL